MSRFGGREHEVHNREVKLGQMLSALIERRGLSRNRQALLDAVGVSAAALSQYAHDQTRPSFQKLVALADFFGVSLDYLVFGQPIGASVDHGPLARYVEKALIDAQARTSRHSALVGRIGRVLAERIDAVAEEMVVAPNASMGGLIQDDEVLQLERYAVSVDILSVDLDFDVIAMPEGEPAAGPFLNTVAANIQRGCTYRFLIPGETPALEDAVEGLRSLLMDRVGGDYLLENCSFRHTTSPVIAGVGLYAVDVETLRLEQPALHNQMVDYFEGRSFGYVMRPNRDTNSDIVMSRRRTAAASRSFEALWSSGKDI
ncbi:MAG: helix-turn-helix domain-containing protein [Pseudonocardiaceae bacterium]